MEPIDQSEEVLEEEPIQEHIRVGYLRRNSDQFNEGGFKYATMNEVRSF